MFDLGLFRQIHHAEGEHVLGVLLPFQRVVISLQFIELRQVFPDIQQFLHQRVLVFLILQGITGPDFFDRAKDFHDQDAVMGDDRAAALTDQVRMRHFLGIANVGHVIHNVIRIFLQGVICRTVER